jgi:hypothetical protein
MSRPATFFREKKKPPAIGRRPQVKGGNAQEGQADTYAIHRRDETPGNTGLQPQIGADAGGT